MVVNDVEWVTRECLECGELMRVNKKWEADATHHLNDGACERALLKALLVTLREAVDALRGS